ncbi:hypothetical protein Xbed_03018 [Xenorhabdus beddingii]|uniref:Uncharacterized protein n=1 Tax=Xenorhabdus beddingii TaxID=40578 RepID=A0A1Y2SJE9_9GAMM|nr:hypothetical protein Xbed_03018 [Xenorhabdus beddingii]
MLRVLWKHKQIVRHPIRVGKNLLCSFIMSGMLETMSNEQIEAMPMLSSMMPIFPVFPAGARLAPKRKGR